MVLKPSSRGNYLLFRIASTTARVANINAGPHPARSGGRTPPYPSDVLTLVSKM
jgi:hypothetical protein